jgi:hypothetical protein
MEEDNNKSSASQLETPEDINHSEVSTEKPSHEEPQQLNPPPTVAHH